MKSEHIMDHEFKAGKRILYFCIANLAVWPLFIIVMSSLKGWSYVLFLPIALTLIYAYMLINALKKPLARISDNKLTLYKMKRVVALDKISSFELSGKYNAEIILDDQPHLSLALHEFSRQDRGVLISFLQKTIEQNKKIQMKKTK